MNPCSISLAASQSSCNENYVPVTKTLKIGPGISDQLKGMTKKEVIQFLSSKTFTYRMEGNETILTGMAKEGTENTIKIMFSPKIK